MSIDERVRTALQRDHLWAIPDGGFDEVVAGARRRAVRRRAAVGGLLAAAVVVATVVLAPRGDDVAPQPLQPGPSQGTPTPTTDPSEPSPIDGTWTTGPVSGRQLRSTLRAAGLEQWATPLRQQLPHGPVTFQLHVVGGKALVHLMPEGRRFDDESVEVLDRRLVLKPTGVPGVHTTYRWHLEGEALRLDFVETTEPPTAGIPGEVYQRAVFTTSPFTRID